MCTILSKCEKRVPINKSKLIGLLDNIFISKYLSFGVINSR